MSVDADYEVLATLSNNPKAKKVLHTVAKGRAVRLRQLLVKGVSDKEILDALVVLREAQLIKETPAPIDELKTYFVTATGLEADRKVKI